MTPSPSAERSRDTWTCSAAAELAGTVSPHNASARASADTTLPASASNRVTSIRGLGPPTATSFPSATISSGPSRRNSTGAIYPQASWRCSQAGSGEFLPPPEQTWRSPTQLGAPHGRDPTPNVPNSPGPGSLQLSRPKAGSTADKGPVSLSAVEAEVDADRCGLVTGGVFDPDVERVPVGGAVP